ncbi:MAG: carbohydrate ABC transporter permease [Verrucomicrobia bacterium]|nr:carbohydrate ABC transporter permease [Verrucomicrobiota bacterium]
METVTSRPQVGRWLGFAALVIFAILSLGPVWIAVKTALTGSGALFNSSGSLLPQDPTLFNFQRVLGFIDSADPRVTQTGLAKIDFLRALINSVIFTALAVIPQIFFSALAAYAFARLHFPGHKLLFFLFVAATMVPAAVLFIPNFILIHDLGWLNTFQGMAAPYALMTPFAVFFLRQMFLATPKDVEEAARIDGATYISIFFRIILPMHQASLATLAILTTVSTWNEFFWPFLIGRDPSVRVIAVAINAFRTQQQAGSPDWTGLMACTVLAMIPIAVLLIVFGRRVVESFQFSGMK